MSSYVLIVEDDQLLAEVYKKSLLAEGIRADVCNDYKGALNKYNPNKHRLVVLDVLLPGKNGLELLKAIRRQPGGNKSDIIMVTGMNTDELNFNNEVMVGLNILGVYTKSQFSIAQFVEIIKGRMATNEAT